MKEIKFDNFVVRRKILEVIFNFLFDPSIEMKQDLISKSTFSIISHDTHRGKVIELNEYLKQPKPTNLSMDINNKIAESCKIITSLNT